MQGRCKIGALKEQMIFKTKYLNVDFGGLETSKENLRNDAGLKVAPYSFMTTQVLVM